MLSACGPQEGQINEISGAFQKQIDAKDKEIAELKKTEQALNQRLAEAEARAKAIQEAGSSQSTASAAPVDTSAIAQQVANQLLPAIREEIQRQVKSGMSLGANSAPYTPPPPSAPNPYNAPLPPPSSNPLRDSQPPELKQTDPNHQVYKFQFSQ